MPRNSKSSAANSQTGEIDFQKIFYTILDRKWIMLSCLAATVLLGIIYIIITPKTYSATTVVQVEQEESKFVKIEDISTQDLKQAEVLKTIETNLTNSALLLGVIQSLKLRPQDLGQKPKQDGTQYTDGEEVDALNNNVSVKLIRGTRLINITASNQDPVLAQKIADEILKEYDRINMAQRAGLSSEANKFLLEESDRLKTQVALAEQEAQAFKDQHPGVALENSQAFIDDKLLALNNKLNDAKQQLFKVQSDYAQVRRLLDGAATDDKESQLLSISSVSSDPAVLQLQKSVSDSEANLSEISKRYRPKHPAYIQAQAQLAGLKTALGHATVQAAQGLATAVESARQTEQNFEADLKVMEQAKLANDKVAIPYNALRDEVDANRQLYDGVRMRLKETEVTREIGSNDVRVVTPAMLPLKPSKPKKMLVLIAAVLGGLLLGWSVIFALSAVDTSFRSVDTAELALGLPALAAVPLVPKPTGKPFLINQDPAGAIAEAFRTLRTSLSIESGETERNVILFTSAVPGEGKSFTAVNYAISLSQLGQPTLLIDADLRLPTVAQTLLGVQPKLGLNSVLTGKSVFEDSVRTIPDIPNLTVLAAGSRVSNPAELLASPAFNKLLREVSEKFNWVVIDTAPVHAVSDTLLLVKQVKSICLVIHAGKTPARSVQRACKLIENAGAKPSGIVLNRISQRDHSYYYYYSGEYGKGVYGTAEST